ncbi:MAG: LPS-assembly protein LptD, partial [Deltaproteobacteria bacterium]|nr:LPS-assembly protein LptD [Deltaproteobacteria bacterium]
KADDVILDRLKDEATAEGNVFIKSGEDILEGEKARFNIGTETGVISDGKVFFDKNNLYLRGETIEKKGDATYFLKRGQATTCDGEDPDWMFTGSDGRRVCCFPVSPIRVTNWGGMSVSPFTGRSQKMPTQPFISAIWIKGDSRRGWNFGILSVRIHMARCMAIISMTLWMCRSPKGLPFCTETGKKIISGGRIIWITRRHSARVFT